MSAARHAPESVLGTIARILAYMGGLAILAIVGASFLRMSAVVAAVGPASGPKWTAVERRYPAFELLLPALGGEPSHYAVLRRDRDGARKDVLTWGQVGDSGPYVMIEIFRSGSAPERFIDAPSEIAARLLAFPVTDDVKPAGIIDGKFGPVPLVDFAIAPRGKVRRCLGFARAFKVPTMQISGWYCNAGEEVVNRAILACAIDRLGVVAAAAEPKLVELFADAELKRTFCGRRNPILAATLEHRQRGAARRMARLRRRIRLR